MRGAGPWLLVAAILCAAAAAGIVRFDYELCHRGVPLALASAGAPVLGLVAGLSALLRRRSAGYIGLGMAAIAANAYYLAMALHTLVGVGYSACG